MEISLVRSTLIETLQSIQADSGYATTVITGTTCPLRDLEGFDSQVAPLAISMLARALGVKIPNSKNIFLSTDGRQQITIDGVAQVICQLSLQVA